MAEADIIPIGTGGRPGRGSGKDKPSSAARSLAGGPRKPPAARRAEPAEPEPDAPAEPTPPTRAARKPAAKAARKPAAAAARPAPSERKQSASASRPPKPTPPREAVAPAAASDPPVAGEQTSPPRPPTTTSDRESTGGIPLADWVSAIESGAREVLGTNWERRLAELLSFVRRRLEGGYVVDDFGFDRELTERLFLAMLRPIGEKWFRIEVRGADNIPDEGGALVVSNHSGTVPVDGLMTMLAVHDHTGRFLRPLGADLVFRLPMVAGLARRTGATLACQEDAERMLTSGELVGVWPEGFKGVGKPFSERYKLQRFGRGGFVSAALRTGVPIVPLSVVGAEEIYPIVGNLSTLARLLNLPYLPVTPFFPLLGPLGLVPLPSKWLLEFGEPIRTDAFDEAEAEDPMLIFNVTDQVRETIQQTLYSLLRERESVFR